MKITKTQQIIAGVVGAVLVISGGVALKKQHDETAAKKAAELAYANRPIVENSCVMNGYGDGSCDFTNVGKTAGAVCGVIQVDGPGVALSNKFCSGSVQPQTTEKVEFRIPAVDKLCTDGLKDWRDVCEFNFVK
jgi:hypothetical protein